MGECGLDGTVDESVVSSKFHVDGRTGVIVSGDSTKLLLSMDSVNTIGSSADEIGGTTSGSVL